MAQIQNRGIASNAVEGSKVRLNNNQSLRGRNAANSADVELIKVNTSNEVEFPNLPKHSGSNVATESYVGTQLANYVPTSEKGANNGVATLDAGGKVPATQLPSSLMSYEGTFDASSTPASPLLNGDVAADVGMVYLASVAGSYNFGAGAISFNVGDWAIYNGTIWQKSLNSNAVVSVNSQTGVVTLNSDNIAEGSTNLYHTTSRARTAAVVNSTAGSETDQAASVAAMKSYVAAQSANISVQTFTLSAGDITNGFITLAATPDQVIEVTPKGFPTQHPVDDYTVAGAVLTFAGDMLLLIAGDKIKVAYSV